MKPTRMLGLAVILLFPTILIAQLTTEEAEQVADNLMQQIVGTINSNKPEEIANYFETDAIMVLGNSQLIRGKENIRKYMRAPAMHDDIIISHFLIDKVDIDFPAVIVDKNTFLITGTSKYQIVLNKAKSIHLPNRWMCVFHREDGNWHIVSYQGTVNIFDNPFLEDTRNIFYLISLVTFLLGIIVTVAWRRVKKRKSV